MTDDEYKAARELRSKAANLEQAIEMVERGGICRVPMNMLTPGAEKAAMALVISDLREQLLAAGRAFKEL